MRLFTVLFFLMPAFAFSQNSRLIISTYQYSSNNRIKNIEPFAKLFAEKCACETEVKSYESVAAMLEAMNRGEPSVIFMNTFGYLLFAKGDRAYIPAAALRVAPGKRSTYQGIIVANKSLKLQTLSELKDRAAALSLALVNPGSTSGNLVPRIGLASAGLPDADAQFKQVSYTKNHALTL